MDSIKKAEGSGTAAAAGHQILDRILAQQGNGAQPQPEGQGAVVDQTDHSTELELDLGGGLKKRVARKDLEDAYRSKAEVAAAREALDKRYAEMGDLEAARALQSRIAGLDAQQRRRVFDLLQGQGEAGEGDDAEVDRVLPPENGARRGPVDHEIRQELNTVKQVLQALATEANERITEKREKSLGEQVDAEMSHYPILASDPAYRGLAKKFAMAELARQKSLDPRAVVQSAASTLQELKQKAETAALAEVGVRQTTDGVTPKGGFKAAHLRNGDIAAAAQKYLGNGANRRR